MNRHVEALVRRSIAAAFANEGVRKGHKISCIKAVRDLLDVGLQQAKEIVDAYESNGYTACIPASVLQEFANKYHTIALCDLEALIAEHRKQARVIDVAALEQHVRTMLTRGW